MILKKLAIWKCFAWVTHILLCIILQPPHLVFFVLNMIGEYGMNATVWTIDAWEAVLKKLKPKS